MTIEDVPFRRQDRRVLNSRKKRVIDRHIIKCALTIAIFLLLAGSALVALNIMFKSGKLFLCISMFYFYKKASQKREICHF